MRVTNKMMSDNMLRNVNSNLRKMNHTQEKLSTGKSIHRPSDDPAGIARALGMRTEEGELAKYQQNIDDADSWLTSTDSALSEVNDVLQRVRELTVYGASDSLDQGSRDALAEEVGELKGHLVEVSNSDFNQKHIFGGHNTTEKPFELIEDADGNTGVTYNGNEGDLKVDISSDVTVNKNLTGTDVFGEEFPEDEDDIENQDNMFQTLENIYQDLKDGDTDSLSNDRLGEIDGWIDKNLENQAEVGARQNRLEMSKNRLQEIEHLTKEELSEVEDADMAETIMELKNQENVHRMALSAGARIIQPTLMDFLQ
ncbi:flagellar hook-associated protein FlgL [Natranaerobius trueperi]|uniref:Flagellar hook-associated protein FlgL n=1 Tax=Natranaerobius trueperi TaxID=759412 RepID=A0A226C0R6_9FIRM|nr:flagellar hook-associated protein FlgL [Natranaerobius trueperi]OWZ84853.1 flagellar hook-associated protein FlgL [Natranaerobius trueperi]